MLIISHRRNTVQLLKETNNAFGVEVDIRSYGSDLIVNHDPYIKKLSFKTWLKAYKHKFLILNIKEEGIEEKVLNLIYENQIKDFFLLDQSFPSLIKTVYSGESRTALRVSEYESVETALSLAGLVDWVWIDFFTHFPLDFYKHAKLKESGFKCCLVSPELHGHSPLLICSLRSHMQKLNIEMDAVCTKEPELWLHKSKKND